MNINVTSSAIATISAYLAEGLMPKARNAEAATKIVIAQNIG